ncbi:MAG: hypothetical protein ACYCSQ_06635 [bacterium]
MKITTDYKNWPHKKVGIADLFLDSENIRLDIPDQLSQDAIINDLFTNEKAMQILESIAQNGLFPDTVLIAVEEGNKFTVIEGNRRLAAVKALLRPEIVPVVERNIKTVLKTAVPIEDKIEVVVAPDRNSASQLLAIKHTQNTMRPWSPLRQAYFYKAQLERGRTIQDLRNDYPSVDINKFLRMINIHKIAKSIRYDSDLIADKVYNERKFPISTLERMYTDKNVQDFLGFEMDGDGDFKINIRKEEFKKGLKRIVQDIVEKKVDSRSLNNGENRKDYLKSIPKEDTPNTAAGASVSTSVDFKEVSPIATKIRKKLAPADINFTLQSPGIKRMLLELQQIDYNKFPNATHDLIRSFLECSLKEYFYQKGDPVKPQKGRSFVFLDDVLKRFKEEMDSIKNVELSQVTQKIISDDTMKPYSAKLFNATNHNPSVFITSKNVEDAWDGIEKLLRYILNPKT